MDSRAQRCPIPPDPFSKLFTRRYQVQNLSFALGGVAQKNLLLSITTPLTVACSQWAQDFMFQIEKEILVDFKRIDIILIKISPT